MGKKTRGNRQKKKQREKKKAKRERKEKSEKEAKAEKDIPGHLSDELSLIWNHFRPLYIGPIQLIVDRNSKAEGYGYVSTQDIAPGTLLIQEKVYLPWALPMYRSNKEIATLQQVLQCDESIEILRDLRLLYPRTVDDVPPHVYERGKAMYGREVQTLAQTYDCTETELLQSVFALECNSFQSGICFYASFLNHSCNSNCYACCAFSRADSIKEFPMIQEHPSIKEVRAVKHIKKGEELFIRYINTLQLSYDASQDQFWNQYGFRCQCPQCSAREKTLQVTPKLRLLERVLDQIEQKVCFCRPDEALTCFLVLLGETLTCTSQENDLIPRLHGCICTTLYPLLMDCETNDYRAARLSVYLRSAHPFLQHMVRYNSDHPDLMDVYFDLVTVSDLVLLLDEQEMHTFSDWRTLQKAVSDRRKYLRGYKRLRTMYYENECPKEK